jgi:hypothetical protein
VPAFLNGKSVAVAVAVFSKKASWGKKIDIGTMASAALPTNSGFSLLVCRL